MDNRYPKKSAVLLEEKDLRVNGFSYQLDFSQLEMRLGEDAERRVIEAVVLGLEEMKNHPAVKETGGNFLVWLLKRGIAGPGRSPTLGLLVILTPALEDFFSNPMEEQLKEFPEYLRMQGISPLYEGAIPFFQCVEGELFSLDLDREFLKLASGVLRKVMEETKIWESNIYRETLLELEREDKSEGEG